MASEKLVYAFRGWIAFVAFMDAGTAVRCFIEKRTFLDDAVLVRGSNNVVTQDPTLPRILGAYSILKAVTLIHCSLFIHYKPIISMAIFSLATTLMVHASESLYFHTAPLGFYVIFPGLLNGLTLLGLALLPKFMLQWEDASNSSQDENAELLRQAGAMRRKRAHRKNL